MENENTTVARELTGRSIRVRGLVQGVGFRPFVYKLAKEAGLAGQVINDASGVLIEAWGTEDALERFQKSIRENDLSLARVDSIEASSIDRDRKMPSTFSIQKSETGDANTQVGFEAATCAECLKDVTSSGDSGNPKNRRYLYPFTNCTHCGPRLTIIKRIPYDRKNTSMAEFPLCALCLGEYENPEDRRYHAQPTACPDCGPHAALVDSTGKAICADSPDCLQSVDRAAEFLRNGCIVAIKGLGGFQFACDATNPDVVSRLRLKKKREAKPLALMAADPAMIRRYCRLSPDEQTLLTSPQAPIVILEQLEGQGVAPQVAAGLPTLGFMLPSTPLHHLLARKLEVPLVLTSGNLSDEPQCTDNDDAIKRLGEIADYILTSNRDIVNRVDDSVVRFAAEKPRMLRRARGYAPSPVLLPDGLEAGSMILAMGGELKNTFCIIKGNQAILSQHIGDLSDAITFFDYKKTLKLYEELFELDASVIAVDMHPEYMSTKLGRSFTRMGGKRLEEVQHHHAHVAACLAENNHPVDGTGVLAITLDGLGYGDDGTLWGGEFLLADYVSSQRLASLKPVALAGGNRAMLEPWRNTFAHIATSLGWDAYRAAFASLELTRYLESKPLAAVSSMLATSLNCPEASSCGRLFDAVAAALGICPDRNIFEGQAAMQLEAAVCKVELGKDDTAAYRFNIETSSDRDLLELDPEPLWQALFCDLLAGVPVPVIAARFHKGLAIALIQMIERLGSAVPGLPSTIVLSGGVFQNKVLLEEVSGRLARKGYHVLTHSLIPANDGGISLGQAIIAAARIQARAS